MSREEIPRREGITLFKDRADAGLRLAQSLSEYAGRSDVIVLALPRGGVPVAFEIAKELRAPLDIVLVRKLGVPGHEELAMGAIASGGVRVLNEYVVRTLSIPASVIDTVTAEEQRELERRAQAYRDGYDPHSLRGKTVLLVDDGLATGATMRAAITGLRTQNPAQLLVAVPTASPETCEEIEREVERVVCAETPQPFYGVGTWYRHFPQITDEEVRQLLKRARDIPQAER